MQKDIEDYYNILDISNWNLDIMINRSQADAMDSTITLWLNVNDQ